MSIRQGYLTRNGTMSLRIRLIDGVRATLTIKSPVSEIRRLEFEYEIPMTDGAALLGLREGGLIEKLRHKIPWQGLVWEVNLFQGENRGLVIAEIELPHEDTIFEKPEWLGLRPALLERLSSRDAVPGVASAVARRASPLPGKPVR